MFVSAHFRCAVIIPYWACADYFGFESGSLEVAKVSSNQVNVASFSCGHLPTSCTPASLKAIYLSAVNAECTQLMTMSPLTPNGKVAVCTHAVSWHKRGDVQCDQEMDERKRDWEKNSMRSRSAWRHLSLVSSVLSHSHGIASHCS